jgi:uncharacterized protein (DUF1501 family)
MTFRELTQCSRRTLLATGGALFASAQLPKLASAASTRDPRLVVMILRGALDGLSTVAPVGDPHYVELHGALSLSTMGTPAALPLDSFFAINPAMPVFAKLFAARQASVVHAVATPYRDRSHFDGQDVLESGLPGPGFAESGWLNRALACLPRTDHVNARGGLAIGTATPLVLRGAAPVFGWAPQTIPAAGDDLANRVIDLYRRKDAVLGQALAHGIEIDAIARREMGGDAHPHGGTAAAMRLVAKGAARLIGADDGPRIAALSFDGWDTHANEGAGRGRLAELLGGLDGAFEELQQGLGPRWNETTIIAITEFGRTARINGTIGTDHGTATVALLVGGALKGGRVIADWPGLNPAQLYQNRDLRPTTDLRSVLKGILTDHLDLDPRVLADRVFPHSFEAAPLKDLIA